MDLFDIAAKITLDDSGYKSGLKKVIGTAGTAAKAIGVGLTAASGAVVALTKQAVNGYKEYEQLVGGVETLFGAGGKSLTEYAESAGKTAGEVWREYSHLQAAQSEVMRNAEKAFETSGLSMNEYMSTVTSFSASLIQSVGGDTVRAAELADQAIVDMSDNANKMGTSMEAIQNAYQGFAKQNYTMLDNLKLGYGGTKTEMERLVADAEKLNSSFKAQRDASGNLTLSYADVVEAIHIVQDEMGIAGATAEEAATTIEGSLNMTKAAWKNLVAGLSNPDADLGKLMSNFTKSAKTALKNIIPAVKQALKGIGAAVKELAPIIGQELPGLISDLLPGVLDAATSLVSSLAAGLPGILKGLIGAIPGIVRQIARAMGEAWKSIDWDDVKETGKNLLTSIGQGIKSAVGNIREWVTNIVANIGSYVSEHWSDIKEKGSEILTAIGRGFLAAASGISTWIVSVVSSIGTFITENGSDIMEKGEELLGKIWDGFKTAISSVGSWIGEILDNMLTSMANGEEDEDSDSVGDSLLAKVGDGFIKAAFSAGEWLLEVLTSIATWIVDHRELIALAGWNLLKAIGKGVANAAVLVLGWMGTIVAQISDWFNDSANIESLKEFGKSIITKIGQGLGELLADGLDWAGDIFDKVKEGAGEAWSTITGIGSDILNNIWNGIVAGWDSFKQKVSGLLNTLTFGLIGEPSTGSEAGGVDHGTSGGFGHAAIGMDYVPYNKYPAMLHRGEAVLTRQEAEAWRSGKSGGSGMTVNIYAQEVTQSTVDYIIARADAELGGLIA